MSSFRLEEGGSPKDIATNAGVTLAILGIVVMMLVWFQIGLAMILLGGILLLGGKYAKS